MAKNRDFSYIPAYDAQLRGWGRGRRRSIVILFGREKLEWCGYLMVKSLMILCLTVLTEYWRVTDIL